MKFITPLLFVATLSAQSIPEIPYDSAPNLLKMPPHIYLGEAAGVATNSKGNIFVYTRTGSSNAVMGGSRTFTHGGARLFEFAPNGTFMREIGQGVYGFLFAHVVRIDPQDNIWVVDEGSSMVIKFDPTGRILLTLGRKPEAIRVPAGEAGEGAPLVRIDVASTEDEVALLRDLDVRRRRRDHGHAVGLRDGGGGEGSRGSLLADQGDDVVARDELGHDRRRLRGFSAVVLGEHVDRTAEHAAGGVDLVGREIDAVASRLREGRGRTGQRAVEPDRDALRLRRLLIAARRTERGGGGEGNEKARAHGGRIIGGTGIRAGRRRPSDNLRRLEEAGDP